MFEEDMDINRITELRCKTTDYFGVGAISKIADIAKDLAKRNIGRIFISTGRKSHKQSGAWDPVRIALEENSIDYILYDKVESNPTVNQLDEAAQMAKEFGAKAVIGIGGGSSIDTAKSVAILTQYPEDNATKLYMQELYATKALPIIAINLTHGTGTEVDRFAVASIPEKQFKPAIMFDVIYPLYSIDDPVLTMKLPADQMRYVTMDAFNHATEASTTTLWSPYSVLLAKESIRHINMFLPKALSDSNDLKSRYYLLLASALAGISLDNSFVHLTHALAHPLSAIKPEISHGLSLAVLLPAFLKATYPYAPKTLSEIYSPIIPDLKGLPSEAERVALEIEAWIFKMGVSQKLTDLGFTESDIDQLVDIAFKTPLVSVMIGLSPAPADQQRKIVRTIYEESFQPYKN